MSLSPTEALKAIKGLVVKRCTNCNSTQLKRVAQAEKATVDHWTFTATLPATKCVSCGESYVNGEVLSRFELSAAHKLGELGIREAAAFKFMRKALALRAIDLAELIGVTPETISRWENKRTEVDLAAFVTVGALVADRLAGRTTTSDRLKASRQSSKPKARAIVVKIPDAA